MAEYLFDVSCALYKESKSADLFLSRPPPKVNDGDTFPFSPPELSQSYHVQILGLLMEVMT